MEPRTIIVTGATSGVGLAIARGTARTGSRVVLLSRDRRKADEAVRTIASETGNPNIESLDIDLSDLRSVRRTALIILERYPRIDVLSNNAAVLTLGGSEGRKGADPIMAVNYFGHFLLTNLLIERLARSAPSRVISVAGGPGLLSKMKIDIDYIRGVKGWNPLRSTLQAALAKTMFTMELAGRYSGRGVSAYVFHPGLVKSGLSGGLPPVLRIPMSAANLFFSSECPTGVLLATGADLEGASGSFYAGGKPVAFPFDPGAADTLWRMSVETVGLA